MSLVSVPTTRALTVVVALPVRQYEKRALAPFLLPRKAPITLAFLASSNLKLFPILEQAEIGAAKARGQLPLGTAFAASTPQLLNGRRLESRGRCPATDPVRTTCVYTLRNDSVVLDGLREFRIGWSLPGN